MSSSHVETQMNYLINTHFLQRVPTAKNDDAAAIIPELQISQENLYRIPASIEIQTGKNKLWK